MHGAPVWTACVVAGRSHCQTITVQGNGEPKVVAIGQRRLTAIDAARDHLPRQRKAIWGRVGDD